MKCLYPPFVRCQPVLDFESDFTSNNTNKLDNGSVSGTRAKKKYDESTGQASAKRRGKKQVPGPAKVAGIAPLVNAMQELSFKDFFE